ncbi:MAG: hypothetical protein E7158_02820 [Firmicutes bacterium]|nr:hypothetical protein [Bacillota bacterium]
MKKIKKLLLLVVGVLIISGCSMNDDQAKKVVEQYLNNYIKLDNNVTSQLDDLIAGEDLTDSQKKVYREILERQYKDMKYKIIDEKYEENESKITAKVTVYDYYKVQEEIAEYLKNNREQFYKDGVYDEDSYIDYKLDTMKKYNETVTYDIDFILKKENNNWVIQDLDADDIEKIHGIYDYSNDQKED